MPIAARASPSAMMANAFTGFVTEDVTVAILLYDEKFSVYRRKQGVSLEGWRASTAASCSNDRVQVIEVLLQRTSAGRGQPVISPRRAASKRLVACNVAGVFELTDMAPQVAVRRMQCG